MTTERPRPVRRYGQNFIADPRLAGSLVALFAPQPEDRVVEIGPGEGALTRHLAGRCARFLALEIDERLLPALGELLAGHPGAGLRHADALEADWVALAAELGGPPLRVIANLPYNVGTAIVRRLLATDVVHDMQFVLQLEVAERLLAVPGTKAFGPLGVLAALRTRREKLRLLAPGCFRPPPKVTSCALRLTGLPAPPLPAEEIDAVEGWLHRGFAQRRKTLCNNIPEHRALVQEFLAARGLPADARAEAVPAADWLALARLLGAAAPDGTARGRDL